MVENVGLENLRLQSTASSGSGGSYKNINLESCAHCWVHNVQSDWAVDRSHIYLSDVYGSEIGNNYVNEGYSHNSGLNYAIYLEYRASENLIQNNIIRKARHSMVMVGGSGNVWGYNYVVDPYMGEYHNSLPENTTHGAHPYMNLWEGNVTPNIEFDFTHGRLCDRKNIMIGEDILCIADRVYEITCQAGQESTEAAENDKQCHTCPGSRWNESPEGQ